MSELHKLHRKLCRELSQSEHSAIVHTRREARRLGDVAPAHALRALAEHAQAVRPRFDALVAKRQPMRGIRIGESVGEVFSVLRHALFDRLIDTERSYRGTLLGCRHGVDIVRLLREVALREHDTPIVRFCDDWLVERLGLLERAEQALAYFADQPARALKSGLAVALEPSK